MGHHIHGLVGEPDLLSAFAETYGITPPAPLAVGLAFLPLLDQFLDEILPADRTGSAPGFVYLDGALDDLLAQWSHKGAIVYVETDYFGGSGSQGAAVFVEGDLVFHDHGPSDKINAALALIGTEKADNAVDLFDTVGLGRYRNNEDWLDAAAQSHAKGVPGRPA